MLEWTFKKIVHFEVSPQPHIRIISQLQYNKQYVQNRSTEICQLIYELQTTNYIASFLL